MRGLDAWIHVADPNLEEKETLIVHTASPVTTSPSFLEYVSSLPLT